MAKLTITKGGRLSMTDLDVSKGHICLHDVCYGGESNLDVDLTEDEAIEVCCALLGVEGIETL